MVINVARDERRFGSIPVEQLEALGLPLLKGMAGSGLPKLAAIDAGEGLANEVLAARDLESRQSLWRIVLGAVIVLVGIETVWSARLSAARSRSI